jgi:hypothetical protein
LCQCETENTLAGSEKKGSIEEQYFIEVVRFVESLANFCLKLQAIVAQKDDLKTSLKINIWSSVFAFCVQDQKYLQSCDTVALMQMMQNLGTFAAVVYAKKFAPKNSAIATVSNTINVKLFDTGRLIRNIGSMLEIASEIIYNFVSCFGSTF